LKKPIFFCLFYLFFTGAAYCGQANRIELADGSVINGEIISFSNGVYTVRTANLGDMNIEASKVAVIKTAAAATPYPNSPITPFSPSNIPTSSIPTSSDISNYGQKLMGNPGNAAVITDLANDPQIQIIAQDPEIEAAVKAGDIQALMNNPKFMDMVNSSKIQEGVRKIKQND
jgi:hypothetical protein